MDTLRFVNAAELYTELERWHHLGECLLLELSLIRFGFGVRLVFDNIWAAEGRVRDDLGEREERLVIELMGVQRLVLEGNLSQEMIDDPDEINWGLSEVAQVRAVPCAAGLRLRLSWEDDRSIVVEASWADVLRPRQQDA